MSSSPHLEHNNQFLRDIMEKDSWATAFPAPKASPQGISCEEVMKLFDDQDLKGDPKSFLLVDIRREDWEV